MGSTGAARGMAGNMPVRDVESTPTLTPEAARTISEAIWGEDAVGAVLDNLSEKLDGYDYLGDGFDVSYQGGLSALATEIESTFRAAGVDIEKYSGGRILSYQDSDGMVVRITISRDSTASTYTAKSKGYYITVENIE